MHKYAVFLLAVIACSHFVFSVEAGRQIKSVNKVDSKQSKVDNSALMHKEDHHQPDAPSYIPKVAADNSGSSGKKEVLPPPLPDSAIAGYKDAFRPTTPGNSPGAGHSFLGVSDDKHSIAGETDDFRRTNPGHSPGVGHVFQTKNSEPNA